jgi:hypothetical protein
MTVEFQALPGFVLTPEIERAFGQDGIVKPSEPQLAAFGPIFEGRHMVIDAHLPQAVVSGPDFLLPSTDE